MNRTLSLVFLAMLCAPQCISAAGRSLPKQGEILQTLRREHPRLLADRAQFDWLAAQCKVDAHAGRWLAQLRERADKLLLTPPVKYEIPDGKRLLAVSREAKERLLLLGLMHQFSGERKYAERAWQELATVIKFKDWNPSHFLDTAEMTFAVAIGYDWLHDVWSAEQRAQLRDAIVRHGLTQGLSVYRNEQWWTKSHHNWNQVCNGGMAIGALAIGDVEPDLAAEVLHAALRSLPLAMSEFAPDGGWGEGPGYWRYATEYNVYLLAALNTALGNDFGLSDMPGFAQTGDFPLHFVGPTGKTFNFADAHESWHGAPQWFWLAQRFEQPAYGQAQLSFADTHTSPLDLVWGARWLAHNDVPAPLPLARCFRGVAVVTMRSAWNDPQAFYVACKGGDNRVNHAHLDLGSFVLDALGERWVIDLGPDDYNLPGYFGSQRWNYFRNNTHSHNTIVIDGRNQDPGASAEIIQFTQRENWDGAIVDLSHAWPQTKQVRRGVALIDGRQVLVQDEIASEKPVEAVWQMLTVAHVEIEGKHAILTQRDRCMRATLVSPDTGRWQVEEVNIPKPQRPTSDLRKLYITTSSPLKNLRFAIVFQPENESHRLAEIVPLEQWPKPRDGR